MKFLGFLIPSWLPLAAIGVLVALLGVQSLRLSWCQTEIAEYPAKAERAKNEALAQARRQADAIILEQAAELGALRGKSDTIIERIHRVEVTTACAQSPAMRAATRGLRELLGAGGGEAPAGRGPDAPVR